MNDDNPNMIDDDPTEDAPQYITDEAILLDKVLAAIQENTRVQQETQSLLIAATTQVGAALEDVQSIFHPKDGSKAPSVGSLMTSLFLGK